MDKEQLLYLLALQKVEGVGDKIAKRLLSFCGSPKAVFQQKKSTLRKIQGIGSKVISNLNDPKNFDLAKGEIDFMEKNNITESYFLDDDYPEKLKHCIDNPILLFQKGNIDLKNQKIISIVGTRNITNYGKSFLDQFILDLKKHNPIIISGLAYGVDIYTHKLALKHGLQTIGTLAHGLDITYPKSHQKYANEMLKFGGLITEFWTKTNPDRENFVKRNRIVAGISEATIVIESAEKGGSLITAQLANSYNREVFAVPGRALDKNSIGCNNLIKKNEAFLMDSVSDLEYFLNWNEDDLPKNSSIQKQLFVDLNEEENKVFEFLSSKGTQSLDVIALHTNNPIFKTASILLNLELKGVSRPLPGKLYELI